MVGHPTKFLDLHSASSFHRIPSSSHSWTLPVLESTFLFFVSFLQNERFSSIVLEVLSLVSICVFFLFLYRSRQVFSPCENNSILPLFFSPIVIYWTTQEKADNPLETILSIKTERIFRRHAMIFYLLDRLTDCKIKNISRIMTSIVEGKWVWWENDEKNRNLVFTHMIAI